VRRPPPLNPLSKVAQRLSFCGGGRRCGCSSPGSGPAAPSPPCAPPHRRLPPPRSAGAGALPAAVGVAYDTSRRPGGQGRPGYKSKVARDGGERTPVPAFRVTARLCCGTARQAAGWCQHSTLPPLPWRGRGHAGGGACAPAPPPKPPPSNLLHLVGQWSTGAAFKLQPACASEPGQSMLNSSWGHAASPT
jgi:hypothetical protein